MRCVSRRNNAVPHSSSTVRNCRLKVGCEILKRRAPAEMLPHSTMHTKARSNLRASGFFRAKMAQENLIKASPIPYTILRSTQFFEFAGGIANASTDGQIVRLPPALMQPIASADVAAVLADVAVAAPVQGTIEVAGPERIRLDEVVRRYLGATRDARKVETDTHARYFGIDVNDQSLTPGVNPRLGAINFESWLRTSANKK